MTNTLHRYGNSFDDDYIVFAIPARGINDGGATDKQRRFLEIARKHHPVNLGDASHGAAYRPARNLNPSVHWRRTTQPELDAVLASVANPTTVAAVFDKPEHVVAFVKE